MSLLLNEVFAVLNRRSQEKIRKIQESRARYAEALLRDEASPADVSIVITAMGLNKLTANDVKHDARAVDQIRSLQAQIDDLEHQLDSLGATVRSAAEQLQVAQRGYHSRPKEAAHEQLAEAEAATAAPQRQRQELRDKINTLRVNTPRVFNPVSVPLPTSG